MKRQAFLVTELVNYTLPGQRDGRRYEATADAMERFLDFLTPTMRQRLATADNHTARLVRLAKALRPVFEVATEVGVASMLNGLMQRYKAHTYLTRDVGQPFHLHFHGDAETAVESLDGEFATALALLMDAYGMRRFGICKASSCDRAYADLTRNGSRRYCSNACTARAKTAAYRRRQAAG